MVARSVESCQILAYSIWTPVNAVSEWAQRTPPYVRRRSPVLAPCSQIENRPATLAKSIPSNLIRMDQHRVA
jgi:hypothetical protein